MGAACTVLGMNAIELKNVSIDYHLDSEDAYSFKNAFLNFYAKAQKPTAKVFRAIDNLSLNIKKGEKVGFIGLNGAGKTTLLRTIAGIFQPSAGEVIVNGAVSPLLDFHTGFEDHLTGIENIMIRLMFLGLSKQEAIEKLPDIISFSELGDFINQPIRTYSAGMNLRLAFATSTSIEPEILVADEVIGTGDAQFALKAKKRLEDFLSKKCTLILSSHSMELIRDYCTRIVWLRNGQVVADGAVDEVIKEYSQSLGV
ncbi:MAG: ABC transporter ATP-binding protein [Rickettsiales bacterium]|nr:MAG: ABC transporter ATP-binding protein [Rickettsiales bacterium]